MRVFQMLQQLELKDGEHLIGVYLQDAYYTCRDDDSSRPLAAALDEWLRTGAARLRETGVPGPGPASCTGTAEVRDTPSQSELFPQHKRHTSSAPAAKRRT